ncbi:unnamed protein product, partial [Meganyctiphanes norvegica]
LKLSAIFPFIGTSSQHADEVFLEPPELPSTPLYPLPQWHYPQPPTPLHAPSTSVQLSHSSTSSPPLCTPAINLVPDTPPPTPRPCSTPALHVESNKQIVNVAEPTISIQGTESKAAEREIVKDSEKIVDEVKICNSQQIEHPQSDPVLQDLVEDHMDRNIKIIESYHMDETSFTSLPLLPQALHSLSHSDPIYSTSSPQSPPISASPSTAFTQSSLSSQPLSLPISLMSHGTISQSVTSTNKSHGHKDKQKGTSLKENLKNLRCVERGKTSLSTSNRTKILRHLRFKQFSDDRYI